MGLLDDILVRLRLGQAERDELRTKRGFSDEIIDRAGFKSTGPDVEKVVQEMVRKHGVDVGLEHGVVYQTKTSLKVNKHLREAGNVIIPYFRDGECTLLRPHKYQLPGVGLQPFFPLQPDNGSDDGEHYSARKKCVLAESEFKAWASIEYGWQAMGVPGISSFTGVNFDRLVADLNHWGIHDVVILWDNEDKATPDSPRFKKMAYQRWDTPLYAYILARRLNESSEWTGHATVGWIPNQYRDETWKADIDGLLAAGVPRKEYDAIIAAANSPSEFLERQPQEAQRVMWKRIKRAFNEEGAQALVEKEGRYLYITDDGPRSCSNFTADYVATLVDPDGEHAYELKLTNLTGQECRVVASGAEIAEWKKFRVLCARQGVFFWSGRDSALEELVDRLIPQEERVIYLRDAVLGWDEELEHFLFTNCAVDRNGNVIEYQEDGTIVLDDRSYRITSEGDIPELIFADSGTHWDRKSLHDLANRFKENFSSEQVVISLAWMCAVALKPWLFELNRTFPILFVFGRRGSGKTRLLKWLTRIFYNVDTTSTDTLVGQNSPAFIRNRAAQLPYLPMWLDEYRNTEDSKRHLDVLRGIYDHSSAGISGGQIGTNRIFNLRCALAISGEDEPDDPTGALNERMVTVRIPDTIAGNHFEYLEQLQYSFDGIFVYLLKNREKLVAQIRAAYDSLVERHRQHRISSRIALNYALLHAVAQVVLDWKLDEKLIDEIFQDLHEEAIETDQVVEMFDTLQASWKRIHDVDVRQAARIMPSYRADLRPCLVMHLKTCHKAWGITARKEGRNVPSYKTFRKIIQNTKWIFPDTYPCRLEGKTRRVYEIDLDLAPEEVVLFAEEIADDEMKAALQQRYGGGNGVLSIPE